MHDITIPATAPIALTILDTGNGRESDVRFNMLTITTTIAKIAKL
jgi:hypothetical protein